MILQQLQKDAERLVEELPPSMYATKPVKWVVALDGNGRNARVQPTSGGEGKKDKGKPHLVPFKNRTSAVNPLLLADKLTYTWGLPEDHKRAGQEHAAYLDLLERCAVETGNPDVAVVLEYLRDWRARTPDFPEIQPDELTTFTVEGRYLVDDPDVRRFWAREAGGAGDEGTPGQCLVCGRETCVVDRLPVTVKGIPNGQSSGVALVSANASAFESYGRSAALVSPICLDCGERFGKATQELLWGEKTCLTVGPVAYLFWTAEGDSDLVLLLQNPQPDDVQKLIQTLWNGEKFVALDPTPFYATALSAAISRAVIRHWLHTTVGAVQVNLARWFNLLRMEDGYGAPGRPLSIRSLAASLYRDRKDILARVPELLVNAALHGGPLPDWLLMQAVQRNRAEQGLTYPRAALIKAVLCSQKEDLKLERLDPSNTDRAYLCGRLLAELEAIQRVAINPKATLVDRFYGTASTAPATVFGTLLRGAQPHLAVLRKTRPGAYAALQARLEDIMAGLPSWPAVLTLREQALFALGYYHQRAEDRRAALEAKRNRVNAADAPVELAEDAPATEKENTDE